MLFLESNSRREFALPLVLSQLFSVDANGHRIHVGCIKETRNIVSDSHEVNGRRTGVLDNEVCFKALLTE